MRWFCEEKFFLKKKLNDRYQGSHALIQTNKSSTLTLRKLINLLLATLKLLLTSLQEYTLHFIASKLRITIREDLLRSFNNSHLPVYY